MNQDLPLINKSWKQPVPTDLEAIFGQDFLSRLIYQELLIKAANKGRQINLNGFILTIERGQAYFTERYLATIFNRHRDTIRKSLERLQNLYRRLDIRRTEKGSIATILYFDDITKMDSKTYHTPTTARTTDWHKQDIIENKKESISSTKEKTSKNSKTPCTLEELTEISRLFKVGLTDVQSTHEDILDQIEAGEFKYKTVYHTLKRWVRLGIKRGFVKSLQVDNSAYKTYIPLSRRSNHENSN